MIQVQVLAILAVNFGRIALAQPPVPCLGYFAKGQNFASLELLTSCEDN